MATTATSRSVCASKWMARPFKSWISACEAGQRAPLSYEPNSRTSNRPVLDNTFSAGAKIEPVRVERRPYQFTYEVTWGRISCTETFEEINIDKNLITNYDLMADGQIVEVMFPPRRRPCFGRASPDRGHGGDLYQPGIRGHRFDQLAQTRYGQHRCDGSHASVHQHGRQDPRRHPHPRVLRAHQVSRQCSGRGCSTSPENRKSPLSE